MPHGSARDFFCSGAASVVVRRGAACFHSGAARRVWHWRSAARVVWRWRLTIVCHRSSLPPKNTKRDPHISAANDALFWHSTRHRVTSVSRDQLPDQWCTILQPLDEPLEKSVAVAAAAAGFRASSQDCFSKFQSPLQNCEKRIIQLFWRFSAKLSGLIRKRMVRGSRNITISKFESLYRAFKRC